MPRSVSLATAPICQEQKIFMLDGGSVTDALVGKFSDQPTDASLIVRIGAFEIGDLAADQRFELRGAGKGALDPVAH